MPISAAILLAGRMLGLSMACGLNVYATIATVGIASRLGWVDALPPALIGLEQWLLIAAAAALFLVELVATAIPLAEPAWEAMHTVVRPVSATALTLVGLEGTPLYLRIPVSILAGLAALAAHATRIGLRISVPLLRARRVTLTAVEALIAGALAVAALRTPSLALAALATVVGLVVLAGPPFWRAAVFALRAIVARVRGFFVGKDWHGADELREPLRVHVNPPETGLAPARLVRAVLTARGIGPWRNGWLVFDRGVAFFVYRQKFRSRRIQLHRPVDATVRPGLLADTLEVQTEPAGYTLHLLKDGPPADIVLGALQLVISPPPRLAGKRA
jgi:hypothetical protein